MSNPARFLVRTKENRITGPFAKEELAARVAKGELRELDEICPAGGYWIFLHERAESKAMLGVELPRSKGSSVEESTETETETVTATAPSTVPGGDPSGSVRAVPLAQAISPIPVENRKPEPISLMKYVFITIIIVLAFLLFRVFELARDL